MEYSKQQLKIINSTANKIVVVASAAAGKTAVLTGRMKHLLDSGVNPKDIVLITFTNAAADEISKRVGSPEGAFIGTIHSYANYLLLSHGEDTSDILDNEEFDKLFERIKKHPSCIKHVEHLLLDESQDSNKTHFEFLLDMIQPTNYMLVGDHRQSIYRWNGAYPDYLIALSKRKDVTTYDLNENYRNGHAILDYARSIINLAGYDYRDNSIAMRPDNGKVITVKFNAVAIARAIKKYGNYKTWFVLTRSNDQVDEIMRIFNKEGVPCSSFKKAQLTNNQLQEEMQKDTVKVLTVHTSKGLEADNVVVVGAQFYKTEEICISYVAATRARNLLVWTQMPNKSAKAKQVSNWER